MSNERARLAAMVLAMAGIAGCEHAVIGNATALVLTLGLFVGTLQLGRIAPAPGRAAEVARTTPRLGG